MFRFITLATLLLFPMSNTYGSAPGSASDTQKDAWKSRIKVLLPSGTRGQYEEASKVSRLSLGRAHIIPSILLGLTIIQFLRHARLKQLSIMSNKAKQAKHLQKYAYIFLI